MPAHCSRCAGSPRPAAPRRSARAASSPWERGTARSGCWTSGPARSEPPPAATRDPARASLAVTADGSQFAVITAGGGVDVFDGATLRRTGRFRPAGPPVVGAALSPDGGTLAMTTVGGTLELWDTRTRRRLLEPQVAHAHDAYSVTFSRDGRWLATGDISIVRLWDVRRHTTAGSFVQGGGSDLSLSPDGTMLAVTALNDRFRGGLEIRSVPSLEVIRTVPVPAGTVGRFTPDGRSLIYGDRDGRVWTLDTRTWKPTRGPMGGGAWILDAAISPDGRLLATTSSDRTGRLWDLAAGRPIGAALSSASGAPLVTGFIRDGTRLAVVHEQGGLAWDVRPASWSRGACAVAARALTRAEWANALPQREYDPACRRP